MARIVSLHRPSIDGVAELVSGGISDNSNPGHPPHWHSEWQVVVVTRGDGWVRTQGTRHGTPGHSLFLIPPEVVHSNNVLEAGCDFQSMLIEPEFFESTARAASLKRLGRLVIGREPVCISPALTRRFRGFHRELCDPAGSRSSLRLESALQSWITHLLSRYTGQSETPLSRIAHPAARRAREFIWAHAEQALSLETVAQAAGLSRFELSRQFTAAFGMPPHAWQLQVRVQRAKDQLKAGIPAGDVALSLGFADQAHFTRVFRRSWGISPGRYAREFYRR